MRRRILLGVFVVSGFSGLIYESIWSQYLKLFLGHAAYAQTLVLVIFMGGLALGSRIVARHSARVRNLLWGYVWVEALIGVMGLVFHRLFVAVTDFSFTSVIPALPAGWPIYVYKWSAAAVLVLPQSILLGMTFPLIGAGLIRRWPDRPGETLATLYFTNSLGAAIGVLVSGFVLIGMVGLPGTILTAALLNIALALLVWTLIRREDEPQPAHPGPPATARSADRLARWFAVAALLTGTASFMYELGWIRMLSLVLGSSTHSFELMLSAFIFGLACGGLAVRKRVDRITAAETYLGGVLLVMGCLAALTLPAYNTMFDFMAWSLRTFTRSSGGYLAFNLMSQSIAAIIMIPTTFCAGMTLPLLTHALLRRTNDEQAIGTIYAVNTLGAIIGVLLTVEVLPFIGVKGVILAGAAIHIGLGLSRLIDLRRVRPWSLAAAAATGIAVFASALVTVQLDPRRMASEVYRTGSATVPADATVTYLRDGRTATISLFRRDNGWVAIQTNGKAEASVQMGNGPASFDEPTMLLAAAVPLSMHPHPERVANVGFGSGITTHMLLTSSAVKHVDSIEIEPLMVEAARTGFGARIRNVFEDPRSHIVFEDAKTFFATSHERYDLIVSEPSNPWVSGVASLFSDEFYEHVTQYLQPGGYFVQWLQTYSTDLSVFASVVKALSAHFDAYVFYNLDDYDVLIVATRNGPLPEPSDRIFRWPEMRAELDRIGVQSAADLQLRRIGDNRTLGTALLALPPPANSDFFPFVDLNATRLRYLQRSASELPQLTVMPFPFLELLSADSRLGPTAEPAARSQLPRDRHVRQALAISRAASGETLDGLEPGVAASLLLLDLSAQTCAHPEGQHVWIAAAREISDLTAPYLHPAQLAGIWNKVTSSPCYRQASPGYRARVDLFVAIARRDAAEIARLGRELLEEQSPKSQDELAYLATVSAAAYVRLGELAQAGSLLKEQWNKMEEPGAYALPLRELLALTQSPGAHTVAQLGPSAR